MQYLGGKSRISKKISEVINALSRWEIENIETNSQNYKLTSGGETFVSLFCGSCSIESKIKGFNRMILNDTHKYLIDLFKGVQNGYELPEFITEE